MKHRTVILIDESGTNLGEMESVTALGVVEGNRLEVKLVSQDKDHGCPVFKMVSSRTLYTEEKMRQKSSKRQRHDIIKEFKIGTKIADHDFNYKVKKLQGILEKGYSVRILTEVRAKGKWIAPEIYEKELEMRKVVLDRIAEKLDGVAVKGKDNKSSKGKDLTSVLFKPVQMSEKTTPTKEEEHREEGMQDQAKTTPPREEHEERMQDQIRAMPTKEEHNEERLHDQIRATFPKEEHQ